MPNPGSALMARGSRWRGSPTSAVISAAPSRAWSSRSADRAQPASRSFEIDRLETPAFVEGRTPYLVRGLVIGASEGELHAESEIEVAGSFQRVHEFFGIERLPGALQPVDQDARRHKSFQRSIVRRLAGKIP